MPPEDVESDKPEERGSVSLVYREMEVTTTMWYYQVPIRGLGVNNKRIHGR